MVDLDLLLEKKQLDKQTIYRPFIYIRKSMTYSIKESVSLLAFGPPASHSLPLTLVLHCQVGMKMPLSQICCEDEMRRCGKCSLRHNDLQCLLAKYLVSYPSF